MLKNAIAVLHVSSSKAAHAHYCEQLGFELMFQYRVDETRADPCFMGLKRDAASLHVSSFPGDAVAGGVVQLKVDDVDALHAEFLAKNIAIDLAPTDQTWGNREMYIKDADGNTLRFAQDLD